jgi:hypothetical protein
VYRRGCGTPKYQKFDAGSENTAEKTARMPPFEPGNGKSDYSTVFLWRMGFAVIESIGVFGSVLTILLDLQSIID